MLKHSWRNTVILLLVMAVTVGCNLQPPKPPLLWIIALDITTSIPRDRFLAMRDSLIPQLVLTRVRSRDVVHLLLVNSDPEASVTVVPISGRRVGLDKEVGTIFDRIRQIEQPPRYKGSTNIGGVLAYAKRIAHISQGTKRAPSRVVVVVLTDGKLEGQQTTDAGEWPDNGQIWFWGVERACEEALKKWATTKMALRPEQFTVVRFSDWETMSGVFGHTIDRPWQDLTILHGLQSVKPRPVVDKRSS